MVAIPNTAQYLVFALKSMGELKEISLYLRVGSIEPLKNKVPNPIGGPGVGVPGVPDVS